MNIDDIIIREDHDFVAVNKPSGLLSIPDREGSGISLKKLLQQKYGTVWTVHRLDKETSGLIVFARNEETHRQLSKQFEMRQIHKIYHGLLLGCPGTPEGSIEAPIAEHPVKKGTMVVHRKGKQALTEYRVLEDYKLYSWAEFKIHTGRTHQIRVHAKYIGHPVVCDELYGDGKPVFLSSFKRNFRLSKNELEERPLLSRLALHASKLTFSKQDDEIIELEAPLPKDLKAVLAQLLKNIR